MKSRGGEDSGSGRQGGGDGESRCEVFLSATRIKELIRVAPPPNVYGDAPLCKHNSHRPRNPCRRRGPRFPPRSRQRPRASCAGEWIHIAGRACPSRRTCAPTLRCLSRTRHNETRKLARREDSPSRTHFKHFQCTFLGTMVSPLRSSLSRAAASRYPRCHVDRFLGSRAMRCDDTPPGCAWPFAVRMPPAFESGSHRILPPALFWCLGSSAAGPALDRLFR